VVVKIGPSRKTINIGYTRHRTKTNKAKNTEKKKILHGIRHPPFYSYIQSTPVKVYTGKKSYVKSNNSIVI
jgi:hypothetical protein